MVHEMRWVDSLSHILLSNFVHVILVQKPHHFCCCFRSLWTSTRKDFGGNRKQWTLKIITWQEYNGVELLGWLVWHIFWTWQNCGCHMNPKFLPEFTFYLLSLVGLCLTTFTTTKNKKKNRFHYKNKYSWIYYIYYSYQFWVIQLFNSPIKL